MSAPATYRRFTLSQRIEHVVLIASFTTLSITGLPQKFFDQPWAEAMIQLMGGIEWVRVIHRFAATFLMLGTVYHFAMVAYQVVVQRLRMTMLPTLTDARDAWGTLLNNLGLTKQRPQMGRYTFEEKIEYWALIWGTVVMIVTGFMLWNPIATTQFLPGQFIPAAKAAHGGEAVLAVLSIIIWHMYSVHLRHFNKSMWTGSLTEDEMRHEHPLELADIKAGQTEPPPEPVALKKRHRVFLPVAGVVTASLLGGIYFFTTFEQTSITTLPPTAVVTVFAPLTPTPLPPTATPRPLGELTWAGYVEPLFANKCLACHGDAGGLSVATYADALAGGDSGPAFIPGEAANSLLVQIQSDDHPSLLSNAELEIVKQWITAGAPSGAPEQ
jgi:cytochrome b subunit of formate dehydrogenase